ncbi:MAG: transposase [Planctomycetes bacterium]|nr:transposase [Planctomycetota bacterium]
MLASITVRGVDRQPLYVDEQDYIHRLRLLELAVVRFDLEVLVVVQMTNHDHILARFPRGNSSEFVQWFNGSYGRYMNERHDRCGHLFQGRYWMDLVEEEGYLFQLASYMHLNPVRAGLVERPEDYPWSSYAGYIDPSRAVSWINYDHLLRQLSPDPVRAREKYRELVERDQQMRPPSPWRELKEGRFLGSDSWVRRTKELLGLRTSLSERGSPGGRIPLETVVEVVARAIGLSAADLLSRTLPIAEVHHPLLAYVAQRISGHSFAEIAPLLGYRARSSVSAAISRFERQRERYTGTLAVIEAALSIRLGSDPSLIDGVDQRGV